MDTNDADQVVRAEGDDVHNLADLIDLFADLFRAMEYAIFMASVGTNCDALA